ncbi:phytoene dehydrogenase [alpha proteobacterium BAL199]|jgi:phytoene desaturase|nr:phytoene dehydrogenase [alpha proteobacterium BAL199]
MSHAIVIGGGFGGMAAALRARAKGWTVTLIDRAPKLGGRAQVLEREGFRHDAGPTVLTAPFLFEELFELFGENLRDHAQLVPMKPWYRFIYEDRSTFDYGGTIAETLSEIRRVAPDDVDGYQNLLSASKEIYAVGFEELADRPFHKLTRMIAAVPAMLRLGAHRSVWQLVCAHLKSEKLRQAFSIQPLLVGGNPFDTTCIYALIHFLERAHGVHFCMGGTGALVAALEGLMRRQGITIRLGETIAKIETAQGSVTAVRLESGERLKANAVISNADPAHLYAHMLERKDTKLSARFKTRHARKSMGLFVVFFGADRQWPDVAHHTIVLGPRYEGLLSDIFKRKTLAQDMSIYLHRPTATDPSFAPPGCDSFYALVPVPNLDADIDWSVEGPRFQARVIAELDRKVLPGILQSVRAPFHMTPADFAHDYLSPAGAGFSIAPTFMQSAWFRFHNKAEGPEGLYLVGAGTHPGAGLPGVISSAKVLDRLLAPSASMGTV